MFRSGEYDNVFLLPFNTMKTDRKRPPLLA
jgi:hypothetical protein